MPGKKISDLDVYDDVNTDKSRRDLLEISKNTGTYGSPTYATNGSRKITIEQLKETLFIKDINSYNQVTTGSPTFDKQAYNGIANAGTYTLPTSVGSYEVLAIILEAELNVTVNGLGTGISDLVFTKQNETALLIDTTYGWLPLAVNKEVNSSAFELLANKENTTLDTSSTKYPTNNLVKTYVDNLGNSLTSGLATKLTIANNLSDLTNTTQARDNLLLGATNDVTHNSITLSNTTVSTLPFINSAKKIISATGALLGTWFQTLTAKSTPVDADTIIVNDSTASFEAKKTTLLQLWTNYIKGKADALYATIASLSNYVDLTNPQTISGQKTFSRNTGNSQTSTGTGTVISNLDCSNFIQAGRTYMNVQGNALSLGIMSGHNGNAYTTVIGAYAGNWSMTGQHNTLIGYANGISLSTGQLVTAVGSSAVSQLTTGSYIVALGQGAGYNITTASNCVYLGTNAGRQLGNLSNRLAIDTDNNVGKSFPFIYGEFDNSILAFNINRLGIGVQNPNARAVLHTQSTSRGFLPPVLTTAQRDAVSWVAGDAGMMIYNSTTNKHQGWNGTTWNDMY